MENVEIVMPAFDRLPGNWLCLDFTHTLDNRFSARPDELLLNYEDLVAWGVFQQLLTKDDARRLLLIARERRGEARVALIRAIDAREALYRIFYAISEEEHPHESDMTQMNTLLAEAMSHACLLRTDDGYKWDWQADEGELNIILWQVVRSAADLLTSGRLDDVRACAADDCRWLFLDTSKNHSRRWCDMQTCGNQAKARRHYNRKKANA